MNIPLNMTSGVGLRSGVLTTIAVIESEKEFNKTWPTYCTRSLYHLVQFSNFRVCNL